jgi:tetrahydromethanopterin S-methyltransferase subunit G
VDKYGNDQYPHVTNQELMERLNILENKVDVIFNKLDQATGAWTFIKIMGSIALGLAVMYNALASYFK